MACLLAGGDIGGAVVDRGTIGVAWPTALGAPSALILGAGEVEAPAPVVGTAQLVIDEAIDGLVADDPAAFFLGQTPRHQLGRPALGEPVEDSLGQSIVAVQPGPGPAPGLGPGLRLGGLVTDLGTGVGRQLARDQKRREHVYTTA